MTMPPIRLIAPDGTDWAIDTRAIPDGVTLAIAFPLNGEMIRVAFRLERAEARELADGLNRDAGNGTARTFPHPATEEA